MGIIPVSELPRNQSLSIIVASTCDTVNKNIHYLVTLKLLTVIKNSIRTYLNLKENYDDTVNVNSS